MSRRFRPGPSVWFALKALASLGLVGYLLWIVDWQQAIASIGRADKVLILLCPILALASLAAGALRWQVLLSGSRVRFPLGKAYRGYLLGACYNLFLPGVVGGDAVRIGACVVQTGCRVGTATASVLVERILGIVSLLGFLLGAAILFPDTVTTLLDVDSSRPLAGAAGLAIVLVVVLLLGHNLWARWLPDGRGGRLREALGSGLQVLSATRGRVLVLAVALSFAFQGIRILTTFVLSSALGLDLPLHVYLIAIPLVWLVTLLPISLGGLGVREGTLVFLLARFGVASSEAVTLSFLMYLNQAFVAILGGIVQLQGIASSRRAPGTRPGSARLDQAMDTDGEKGSHVEIPNSF